MKTTYAGRRENAEASYLSPPFLPQKRHDLELNAATVLKATLVNARPWVSYRPQDVRRTSVCQLANQRTF